MEGANSFCPHPNLPAGKVPAHHIEHLSTPQQTPRPDWFFKVNGPIEEAWVEVMIHTPGAGWMVNFLQGSSLPGWVAQNQKQKTNQIYQRGNCGIFGFAQSTNVSGQPSYTQWIYTYTAGVTNPRIHPPS